MFDTLSVNDPRVLRGMAHPIRGRLIDELIARGHARATDLAVDLGLPVNQVSFHLRQLAKYGFIQESAEHRKDKRDRVWEPRSKDGLSIADDLAEQPGGEAALDSLATRSIAVRQREVVPFFSPDRPEGTYTTRDIPLRISGEQAVRLADLLFETARDFAQQDPTTSGDEGPEVQTYLVRLYVGPYPDQLPDKDETSSAAPR